MINNNNTWKIVKMKNNNREENMSNEEVFHARIMREVFF